MNLVCGNCGYDVRGLPSTVCPECGMDTWAPELRLKPPPSFIGIVLRLLIGSLLFGVSLLLLALLDGLVRPRLLSVSVGAAYLLCVAAGAALAARRVSRGLPRRLRKRDAPRLMIWLALLGLLVNTPLALGVSFIVAWLFDEL